MFVDRFSRVDRRVRNNFLPLGRLVLVICMMKNFGQSIHVSVPRNGPKFSRRLNMGHTV